MVTDHRLAQTDEGAIVCTAQDVTDERRRPTTRTEEFELLIDAMDDYAFYTLDHQGYVTCWNRGAERLKGYPADEVIGLHMSVFFTDEDRRNGVPEQLIEAAKTDGMATQEGWRLRSDGSRFRAEATISASYDDAGTIRGFGKVIRESPREPIRP